MVGTAEAKSTQKIVNLSGARQITASISDILFQPTFNHGILSIPHVSQRYTFQWSALTIPDLHPIGSLPPAPLKHPPWEH